MSNQEPTAATEEAGEKPLSQKLIQLLKDRPEVVDAMGYGKIVFVLKAGKLIGIERIETYLAQENSDSVELR